MRIQSQSHRGFTLLELIVVITIIGLLSSVVVVSTQKLPARARNLRVREDMQRILTVANTVHIETGRYPESIREMVNVEGMVELDSYPLDAWGHHYLYEVGDGEPRVTCLGSDGQPGGEGEAADVTLPAQEGSA